MVIRIPGILWEARRLTFEMVNVTLCKMAINTSQKECHLFYFILIINYILDVFEKQFFIFVDLRSVA